MRQLWRPQRSAPLMQPPASRRQVLPEQPRSPRLQHCSRRRLCEMARCACVSGSIDRGFKKVMRRWRLCCGRQRGEQ